MMLRVENAADFRQAITIIAVINCKFARLRSMRSDSKCSNMSPQHFFRASVSPSLLSFSPCLTVKLHPIIDPLLPPRETSRVITRHISHQKADL